MRRISVGDLQDDEKADTEVAKLNPHNRRSASAAELVARRQTLPRIDTPRWRAEVASVVDETL